MKKDFLLELGVAEDVATKIMAENGKDIQREQAKFADYDELKKSLETTTADLNKLKDMKPEELQAKIAELNTQLENTKSDSAKRIAEMETTGRVKDYLAAKKFVNELTKDAITNKMKESLLGDGSKGKSLDDIYGELTKDLQNIVIDDNAPKPPVVSQMGSNPQKADDEAKIRAVMGLPAKKE